MANLLVATTIAFALLAHLASGSSIGDWSFNCLGGNYTLKSEFGRNLKMAAGMLARRLVSSSALFATEAVGTNGETVYVLAYCRGDTDKSICKRCVAEAFEDAQLVCESRKGAFVFRDLCTMGYYNKKILWVSMKPSIKMNSYSSPVDLKGTVFDEAVGELAKAVADTAVMSRRHFGTGQKEVDAVDYKLTIYALAQCVPSMSADDCSMCLADLVAAVASAQLTAGRASTLWCTYRFGIEPFFSGEPRVWLPADGASGMDTPPAAKHNKVGTVIWVAVAVGAAVTVVISTVLLLCWCWWWKRKPGQNPPSAETSKVIQLEDKTDQEAGRADTPSESRQVVCPSALDSFKDIVELARGKVIALFLDYDGTLAPIVNNPAAAFMSEEMRDVLREAARLFPTSVVSGRERQTVVDFVKLEDVTYCGSHGMDIMVSTKHSASTGEINAEPIPFQPAATFLVELEKVARALTAATSAIQGTMVENNKFCVTVHYRNVEEKDHLQVRNRVHEVLEKRKEFCDFKLFEGHMHFDIRPPVEWNKGTAVLYLLEKLQQDKALFGIHIGDDRTDEDAFMVLREGKNGMGVLVSEKIRETNALYSLKNPSEVMIFLEKLVKWRLG